MGDYNAIHRAKDRMVGATVQEDEIRDFESFLVDIGMTILRNNGRQFTWTNGHTYSRID